MAPPPAGSAHRVRGERNAKRQAATGGAGTDQK